MDLPEEALKDLKLIEATRSEAKYILENGLMLGADSYTLKQIIGNGATITDSSYITIFNMFKTNIDGLTFNAPTYIEGLRMSNVNLCVFVGKVFVGKYNVTGISSWSFYWNEFNSCNINKGIEFNTSTTNSNCNSNSFNNCNIWASGKNSIITVKEFDGHGTFSGMTFADCDLSYAPIFDIQFKKDTTSVTILGGFIDSGTKVYTDTSYELSSIDVIGTRNIGGTRLLNKPKANIALGQGGARPKTSIPVSSLSLFNEDVPTSWSGSSNKNLHTTIPFDGDFTISLVQEIIGEDFNTIKFTNTTTGQEIYGCVGGDGFSSYTFNAHKGDNITLALDGKDETNVIIHSLTLTTGAGVYGAVPKKDIIPSKISGTITTTDEDVDLFTFNTGSYTQKAYKFKMTNITDIAAGGIEVIEFIVTTSSGSSSSAATYTEIYKARTNGVGGTSDDADDATMSVSTDGLTCTVTINNTKAIVYTLESLDYTF
jgi:hypothetical protein